jgi:choline dehydrogenase-like flavoprotein
VNGAGPRGETFDYVIVGAGAAGAALAGRLSSDPSVSVLLLEAGGVDKKTEIHIPAAFSALFRSDADWNYDTVPQEQLNGRRVYWPRGRVLGGSSSMNAMMWVLGGGGRSDLVVWGAAPLLPPGGEGPVQRRHRPGLGRHHEHRGAAQPALAHGDVPRGG